VTTTPPAGLSRRTLFGLGGSTLLAAAVAAVWRRHGARAEGSPQGRADGPIPYADHNGWMVSLAEKQALRAGLGDWAGTRR
jgi:hypothetical protein